MFGRRRRKQMRGTEVPEWYADWGLAWGSLNAGRTRGWEPPLRILVEQADAGLAWATERALRRKGWDVATCPGPERLADGACPLLLEGQCPAARGADAILFALPLADERNRSILRAHRSEMGMRPVFVETTIPEAERYEDVVRDLPILNEPVLTSTVVRAFEEALSRSANRGWKYR